MSTRSYIGMKLNDGSIKAIYCHFDGYLDGVGQILKDHYTNEDKILKLLNLGNISILGPEIGERQDFNKPNRDWTLAYGRDRGDRNEQARLYSDEGEFLSKCQQDYTYLFKDNKWYVRKYNNALKLFEYRKIRETIRKIIKEEEYDNEKYYSDNPDAPSPREPAAQKIKNVISTALADEAKYGNCSWGDIEKILDFVNDLAKPEGVGSKNIKDPGYRWNKRK